VSPNDIYLHASPLRIYLCFFLFFYFFFTFFDEQATKITGLLAAAPTMSEGSQEGKGIVCGGRA